MHGLILRYLINFDGMISQVKDFNTQVKVDISSLYYLHGSPKYFFEYYSSPVGINFESMLLWFCWEVSSKMPNIYDRYDFDFILTIYRRKQKLTTSSKNPFSKRKITSQKMKINYCMTSILGRHRLPFHFSNRNT